MKYFDPKLLKPRAKPAMPTNDELIDLVRKLTGHMGPIEIASGETIDGLTDKLTDMFAGAIAGAGVFPVARPVVITEANVEVDTPERVVIRGKVENDNMIMLAFNPSVVDTIVGYDKLVGLTSDDLFDMFDAFVANPSFAAIGPVLQFTQAMDDERVKCVLVFISRSGPEKLTISLMCDNGYQSTFPTHIDIFATIDPSMFSGMSMKQIQTELAKTGLLAVDSRDMQKPGDEAV